MKAWEEVVTNVDERFFVVTGFDTCDRAQHVEASRACQSGVPKRGQSAETDFGQTDFGHPYLTDFGQLTLAKKI